MQGLLGAAVHIWHVLHECFLAALLIRLWKAEPYWTHPFLRQRWYHNVWISNYEVVPQQFKFTVSPPQRVGCWVSTCSDCIHWPLIKMEPHDISVKLNFALPQKNRSEFMRHRAHTRGSTDECVPKHFCSAHDTSLQMTVMEHAILTVFRWGTRWTSPACSLHFCHSSSQPQQHRSPSSAGAWTPPPPSEPRQRKTPLNSQNTSL